MTNQTLVARYIYAVTRNLPKKSLEETGREIQSLIEEMLGEDTLETASLTAVEDVLKRLGEPDNLALKYLEKERSALISGTNLLKYKRLLMFILPIVAGGIIAHYAIFLPLGIASFFGDLHFAVLGGLCLAFTIITVVFAIRERTNKISSTDFLASLPLSPNEKRRIPLHEPIAHIIAVVALTALFMGFFPLIKGKLETTEWMPMFSTDVLRSMWYFILPAIVIDVLVECYKLVKREYTLPVAHISAGATVVLLVLATIVFANPNVINPDFLSTIASEENLGRYGSLFLRSVRWQILASIYIISIVDLVFVYLKTLKK